MLQIISATLIALSTSLYQSKIPLTKSRKVQQPLNIRLENGEFFIGKILLSANASLQDITKALGPSTRTIPCGSPANTIHVWDNDGLIAHESNETHLITCVSICFAKYELGFDPLTAYEFNFETTFKGNLFLNGYLVKSQDTLSDITSNVPNIKILSGLPLGVYTYLVSNHHVTIRQINSPKIHTVEIRTAYK